MTNVNNIQFLQGVDALQGDTTAPVFTTQAEKSAPANASIEKDGNTQRTNMINSDIHIPQDVDTL